MAYTGWELTEAARSHLLALYPPRYADVVAHHVTHVFGVPEDATPPEPARIEVVGMADDGEKVQALVVSVNGSTLRPCGKTYHVTWSIDRAAGAKPADSNNAIVAHGYTPLPGLVVDAHPRTFS